MVAFLRARKTLVAYILIAVVTAYTLVTLQNQTDKLNANLRQQAITQKLSTSTRVNTVQSRCDLTQLLVHTAEKAVPSEYPQYHASLVKCKKQLATVKSINAYTPTPK